MSSLYDYIRRFYAPEEFPALAAQISRWRDRRPLEGKRIFDATPVFRNTMVKYYALQSAGAEVVAAVGENIPCDMEICRILPEFGIQLANEADRKEQYDVVADCAGSSRNVSSVHGYVELTRSGLEYYADWSQPVFSADSGVLKKLETILGTGEGFLRAMKLLKYDDFPGKNVLVFGGGKVGQGVKISAPLDESAAVKIQDQGVAFTVRQIEIYQPLRVARIWDVLVYSHAVFSSASLSSFLFLT